MRVRLAAGVVAVVAVLVVGCGSSSKSSSSSSHAPSSTVPAGSTQTAASASASSAPHRLTLVAKTAVSGGGLPLQVGLGSVWSASPRGLVRLSIPGGQATVVVRSPVDDLALSGGFVYALSRATNTVIQFDPRQMKVTRRWKLPRGSQSITAGDHAIYVAAAGPPVAVERIDVPGGATRRVTVPHASGLIQDEAIAAGAGAVWVSDGSALYRLDPTALSLVRSTSLGATSDIWFGDGSLWAASENPGGGVERIDPASGRVAARSASDATQIAFSPHAVWLGAAAGPTAIDPATAKTEAALPVPEGQQSSAGIAVVGNEVWIAYTDIGTLVRLRPSG